MEQGTGRLERGIARSWSVLLSHESSGQSLVEFALTAIVLMTILIAVFDMGRAVFAQNALANATREGARYGTIAPTDSLGIRDRVIEMAVGLDADRINVVVEPPEGLSPDPAPDPIRVTVTYDFQAVTPFVGSLLGENGTLTLRAVSSMNTEGAQ